MQTEHSDTQIVKGETCVVSILFSDFFKYLNLSILFNLKEYLYCTFRTTFLHYHSNSLINEQTLQLKEANIERETNTCKRYSNAQIVKSDTRQLKLVI